LEASPIIFVKLHLTRKNKMASPTKPNGIEELLTIERREKWLHRLLIPP
jgi:hypothetical protein